MNNPKETETHLEAAGYPNPDPLCKKVLVLLTLQPIWEKELCGFLTEWFGPIDYRGSFFPFDATDYYFPEMGGPLYRGLASFRGLGYVQQLPEWKQRSRNLEQRLSLSEGHRTVNLDIGYIDFHKLVLASFKSGPCKMYLGQGVWGDWVMGYSEGEFKPNAWAFPDFQSGRYNKDLLVIRDRFKAETRQGKV